MNATRLAAATYSGIATIVAVSAMFWTREQLQVRTLPERILEWSLLFVPLDVFEAGLRSFGTDAKVIGLYGNIVGLVAVLFTIGYVVLRRSPNSAAVWVAGVALWAFAMAVVMPITGGGLFGSELPNDPLLANLVYAAVAMSYVAVLLAGRAVSALPNRANLARRQFLFGAGGSLGAVALALVMGSRPRIRQDIPDAVIEVLDPPEPRSARESEVRPVAVGAVPGSPSTPESPTSARLIGTPAAAMPSSLAGTGAAPTPIGVPVQMATPVPTSVSSSAASAVSAPTRVAAAQPTLNPTPTAPSGADPAAPKSAAAVVATATPPSKPTAILEAIPQPPPPRNLKRDHDGASQAAIRPNGELAALITPTDRHYVVSKNPILDPVVDGATWRLVLDGEFARPVQLDYRTLRRLPSVEIARTLECISNFTEKCHLAPFGCNLISTAKWRGARLSDVLALAGGLKGDGKFLTLVTADEFNAVIPADVAMDPECVLAYEMNGGVIPREHGYPTRLLVPGRYGMKNAKWVVGIRGQSKDALDWYGQRNWNRDGIAKTMSRIDSPGEGAILPPGRHRIAGIAYGGTFGVGRVEFSSDGGATWHPSEIVARAEPGREGWAIWEGIFEMPKDGSTVLRSRMTDKSGVRQIEVFSLPQPNGASGWHSVEIRAA